MDDLVSWKSWLEGDCDTALYANLNATDDCAICIGVGSAAATTTTSGTATQTPTTTTSSSIGPTPIDTVSGCEKFYTTTKGDDCHHSRDQNPSVGSTCTNLWLEKAYCVKGPASTTSATASAATRTGIASNYNQYYTVVSNDSCAKIETAYGIAFAELYKWNPAIESDCEYLGIGYLKKLLLIYDHSARIELISSRPITRTLPGPALQGSDHFSTSHFSPSPDGRSVSSSWEPEI
ncbi:uncharacterized protein N7529_009355 [Penicillium soppii]|uniref:uncharacterized protein n=1 Tax=Penicillium soppii TaxID=69789 RepID=UPI002548A856|nr:uncharacterized protein N7529_009355 [Penicillium soppii]KAJ5855411.1 hypothetical protein N7529_009355 [Penicillium soppii]